jgi:hypothetical protein
MQFFNWLIAEYQQFSRDLSNPNPPQAAHSRVTYHTLTEDDKNAMFNIALSIHTRAE